MAYGYVHFPGDWVELIHNDEFVDENSLSQTLALNLIDETGTPHQIFFTSIIPTSPLPGHGRVYEAADARVFEAIDNRVFEHEP